MRRIPVLLLQPVFLACAIFPTAVTLTATSLPTPTVTATPPSVSPVPTLPAAPTADTGWLTYHNGMVGYSFDYPPEATLTTSGVTGHPSEELPAGVEPGQYFATLEATYTEALCAGIELPAAFLAIEVPFDKGGQYGGPCGVTGVGVYDLKTESAPITIDGETATVTTITEFEVGTDQWVAEFSNVRLADGTRFNFGSKWSSQGAAYEDYLADRAVLLQVMASYRRDP